MSSVKNLVRATLCSTVLALSGMGCMGTKVHFADVPLDKLDLTRGRTITATSSGFQLLLFIPIGINGRQAEAYERLKKEAGNDYITDIKIQESWSYAFVGTVYRTTLTATAYPDKSVARAAAGQTLSGKLAELKELRDKGELSEAEYQAARKKIVGE